MVNKFTYSHPQSFNDTSSEIISTSYSLYNLNIWGGVLDEIMHRANVASIGKLT